MTHPAGLTHALRAILAGRRAPGLARRWRHLEARGWVLGTIDCPLVTPAGHLALGRRMVDREAAELARWDATESYFTSGWITEQGLRLVLPGADRMIDLGAGAGVFGQRAKLIDPRLEVFGVELRDEEQDARRHYDELWFGDMFTAQMRARLKRLRAGLVVANPPFSWTAKALDLALDVVAPGGEVLFLVRADWGGAEADWDYLLEHGPAREYLLGGRPRYRKARPRDTDNQAKAVNDLQGAKWLRWRTPTRNCSGEWPHALLSPRLPSASLGWTERPGTEAVPCPLPPAFYPEIV